MLERKNTRILLTKKFITISLNILTKNKNKLKCKNST